MPGSQEADFETASSATRKNSQVAAGEKETAGTEKIAAAVGEKGVSIKTTIATRPSSKKTPREKNGENRFV